MSELSIRQRRRVSEAVSVSLSRLMLVLTIVVIALIPLTLRETVGLTIGMQLMVLTVFAYSYQLLFGLASLLSFGHAVYFGIGAFVAAHFMISPQLANIGVPVEVVPLAGLLSGALVGIILGFPTSRSSGTPFAMVTLGIGELVGACFLMFPLIFGGESGISSDRAALPSLFGGHLATTRQIYPVVLVWSVILIASALWIRCTPLGLLARGIRNNPERVSFVGFDPAALRFKLIVLSGMLAGAAGAMSAMVYEVVSVETVSLHNSANVLIATVVGGAGHAIGPLIGAALLTFMQAVLPGITNAWPMYYGLIFTAVILGAPNGIAGLFAGSFLKQPKATVAVIIRAIGIVVAVEWLYRTRGSDGISGMGLYLGPVLAAAAFACAHLIDKSRRGVR